MHLRRKYFGGTDVWVLVSSLTPPRLPVRLGGSPTNVLYAFSTDRSNESGSVVSKAIGMQL